MPSAEFNYGQCHPQKSTTFDFKLSIIIWYDHWSTVMKHLIWMKSGVMNNFCVTLLSLLERLPYIRFCSTPFNCSNNEYTFFFLFICFPCQNFSILLIPFSVPYYYNYYFFKLTKDEHKVEHKTNFNANIYTHLRN